MARAYLLVLGFLLFGKISGQCPKSQSVVEGQQGKIECTIPNLQGERIWRIKTRNDTDYQQLDGDQFQVEPSGLVVKNASSNYHDSVVQVQVKHPVSGQVYRTDLIELTVYSPAVIESLQTTGNGEISCKASGYPRPNITWLFQLNVIDTIPQESITKDNNLVSTLRVNDTIGSYQCIASNRLKTTVLSIYYNIGGDNETVLPSWIQDVKVVQVTDSSVKFMVALVGEGLPVTHIKYLYIIHGDNPRMRQDINGSVELGADGYFTLSGFPKGLKVTFHFASAAKDLVGMAHYEGIDVYLLPSTPQIFIKSANSDFALFEFRQPTSVEGIDYYEIKYSGLTMQSGEFVPPTCITEIKLPSCSGIRYKLYRTAYGFYEQVEVRVHNQGGYSDWAQQLLAKE